MSREYEISYLTNPSLTDDARQGADRAVEDVLSKADAALSYTSESTRRRIMYPMAGQQVGFLRTIQAALDPAKVEQIRHDVRRVDGVMRLAIIQTARREDVSPAIFETVAKQQVAPKKAVAVPKKPAGPKLSQKEVEEKIEKALDEKVK